MHISNTVVYFAYFIIAARLLMQFSPARLRMIVMSIPTVAFFVVLIWNNEKRFGSLLIVLTYLLLISGQYLISEKRSAKGQTLQKWGTLLAPIIAMIAIKYFLPTKYTAWFVGISYMAFRMTSFSLEVQNGVIQKPSLVKFLVFVLFPPTFFVGPIQPYSSIAPSIENPDLSLKQTTYSLFRITQGALKYVVFGNIINQLTYSGLLGDGMPHPRIDIIIAIFAYYLYLYFNFSGFCDFAVGLGGLIGAKVMENFDSPFTARNIKEFWNRWHISLSNFLRDLLFTPISKGLIRRFGPKRANHAIAIAIASVFIAIGLWHGLSWNFLAFGAFHAVGVAFVHYYTIWLKKYLTREQFQSYMNNAGLKWATTALTFCFMAVSLLFFANTWQEATDILQKLI